MKHTYIPQSVCPMKVEFDLNHDIVSDIRFYGGCNGNLKAIASLIDGMTVDQITQKLGGNTCGTKKTSCADQLTIAIQKAFEEERKNK